MDDLIKVILDYVKREYIEEGDDREVGADTPLISGGIVDSFSMVSLKRFVEKKYGLQIPDADATPAAFDSVTKIADAGSAVPAGRTCRPTTVGGLWVAGCRGGDTMAYGTKAREWYQSELAGIQAAGLLKEERYIRSRQDAEIDVEYPAGAKPRHVINLCANNYLGLSSHPEVIEAARKGLDTRGYGMSSVRFICGTQDIHRDLERRLTSFLGTEDTLLFPSCMDANGGRVRGGPGRAGRHHRRPADPRVAGGRDPAVQGDAGLLQALRHGAPGGEARRSTRTSASG